jgi:hypothetical protein
MSVIRPHHFSARWKAGLVAVLILLALGEVATNAWLLGESRTTAKYCKLVKFFGDQTKRGIDTNNKLIVLDKSQGKRADAVIRQQNVNAAQKALVPIQAAQC